MRFHDRFNAGQILARNLLRYRGGSGVLVLALPRGGVPVGYEVARALNVPLDVLLVRKLGVPGHEELAMGAIASGGVRILNIPVIRQLNISWDAIEASSKREQVELQRREQLYRGGRPPVAAANRTVILVDDGLATGSTMRVAVAAVRRLQPHKIIVAVPVGAAEVCQELKSDADEVVCTETLELFDAVGAFYDHFDPVEDDEVRHLLQSAAEPIQ
jgi:predicted phosphoribosyltransferase